MSSRTYDITPQSVMYWANAELEHVGRIASMKDKSLQYSYAQSTINGMAHLKDAIFQLVNDPEYKQYKPDLLVLHGKVVRTMKHLIKDYRVDLNEIRDFNTRKVLSDLSYLTRKNRNTVKSSLKKVKQGKKTTQRRRR
jgi:hypothetical protein